MSFLLVRVLLTAVIREIRSWRCHILESLIFQHSQCRFQGAPYITTAHLGQRHQPKAYNLVAFQVVNHDGKPLVWFFFSKVEAFIQHVRVCKGYSAPPHEVESTRVFGAWPDRENTREVPWEGWWKTSILPTNDACGIYAVWCPLASFHTDAPLGTPFQ